MSLSFARRLSQDLARRCLSSAVMNHTVFVYGTLKRGQPNHKLISDGLAAGDCALVGVGATADRFPLVVASRYNIPFLLDARGKGKTVKGRLAPKVQTK